MKIIGAERNNEWWWVERWKHFSRKFYLWQKDGRSTGFIFHSVFVPPLTYKNNNKQSNLQRDRGETSWPKPFNLVWIVRCFETADLTISVIPPFISKTTNKRGHACNPTVTYCSVTRAITRVTYTFDNAVSLLELDFRAEASAIRRSSSSKLIASTKA